MSAMDSKNFPVERNQITGISRAQYEILAAEYIAHAEDDGSKVSEMFKGDSSEKHKSKGWTNAMPKNKRS